MHIYIYIYICASVVKKHTHKNILELPCHGGVLKDLHTSNFVVISHPPFFHKWLRYSQAKRYIY